MSFPLIEAKSYRWLPGNDADAYIKVLEENGPFIASFDVFSDFYAYSKGVYVRGKDTKCNGSLAVTIVGYGTENGIDYWRCQNSWGPKWGD